MEWTPLIASRKAVQSLVDRALTSRQYALKEPGVGQAAHLIKDANASWTRRVSRSKLS